MRWESERELIDPPSSQREFGLLFIGVFVEEPVAPICLVFSPPRVEQEHIEELSPWFSNSDGAGQDSCLCSRIKTNKVGKACGDHLDMFSVEKLKPRECTDFMSGRSRGWLTRWNSALLRLHDCLLLNVFIESVKVPLDKNSSTMLVYLAFKLWSKSHLVNNILPWPGDSYIHMSKCFRTSANTDKTFVKSSGLTWPFLPLSRLINSVHL